MDALVTHDDCLAEVQVGQDASVAPVTTAELLEHIRQLGAVITSLQLEVRILTEQLRAFKQRRFGASSERRIDQAQVVMAFIEEPNTAVELKPAEQLAAQVLAKLQEPQPVNAPVKKQRRGGRRALNPNLERIVQRQELAPEEQFCPHDGTPLRQIGVEVCERLHIIPAQHKVLRIERAKYACPCCDQGLRVAALQPHIIPRSILTEESLAWMVAAKFLDGMPLYRLAKSVKRYGGDLAPNTLAQTVVRLGHEVVPLINLLRDAFFDQKLVHGDETWIQVLKEPGRAAQTKSYLWEQSSGSGPPIRLFHYAPGRGLEQAAPLYEGIAPGTVFMTDGYEVYETLAKKHGLVHLGCWAHARRYVVEAEDCLPKDVRTAPADAQPAQQCKPHLATQLRQLIKALFAVEDKTNRYDPATDGVAASDAPAQAARRLAKGQQLRQEHSTALLERIRSLVLENLTAYPPRTKMGQALVYLNNQWPKLARCMDNPAWPISNNAAENSIRPVAVGRRAWLFADTVGGATANANLYSLVETCRANGLNPYQYLCAVFKRLPRCKTATDYEALLPWRIDLK